MPLSIEHFSECLTTLETALNRLRKESPGSTEYDVFRLAVIKGFELSLELAGKLLRKVLRSYGGTPREIDALLYKDVFRRSAKHGLVETGQVERWFQYQDNRNQTAHDYGSQFAEKTLTLLPGFLSDARELEKHLRTLPAKTDA